MIKLIKTTFWVGWLILAGLYSCVQPYSRLKLYKKEKVSGMDMQPMANLPESDNSLKYENILFLLQAHNMNAIDVWHVLKSIDKHWKLKGDDIKTKQVFYENYESPTNKEALVWHSKVNAFEYVTTNVNHCLTVISELKKAGYKLESTPEETDVQYSNGDIRVTISRVVLHDGTGGYQLLFKNGNNDHSL